jgi:predicted transport protein
MDTSQMACKNRLSKDTYVAVDVKKKKKIVSLEVTSEEVHDSKMLKKMVDNASKNNVVKRVLADDGTYMTVR